MGSLDALPAPSLRGFSDKLGERSIVEPDDGVPLEVLCLSRPLVTAPGFEAALAQAVGALAGLQAPGLQNPPVLERIGPDGKLALVTTYTPGRRLSALLAEQEKQGTRLTTSSALHIIREVLSSLRAVHGHAPGCFHGTVGPERILLTRDLRVVLAEHVLGHALLALPKQSASNVWIRFGLAVPDIDGFPSFGPLTDQVQVGLLGLAMLLGRPVAPDEYPGGVRRLLNDARETDLLGDVQPVGAGLRTWLDRLLLLSPQGPFSSIAAAERALADLLSDDSGYLAVPVGLEVTPETLTPIHGRVRPTALAVAPPSPGNVVAPTVASAPPAPSAPLPAESTAVERTAAAPPPFDPPGVETLAVRDERIAEPPPAAWPSVVAHEPAVDEEVRRPLTTPDPVESSEPEPVGVASSADLVAAQAMVEARPGPARLAEPGLATTAAAFTTALEPSDVLAWGEVAVEPSPIDPGVNLDADGPPSASADAIDAPASPDVPEQSAYEPFAVTTTPSPDNDGDGESPITSLTSPEATDSNPTANAPWTPAPAFDDPWSAEPERPQQIETGRYDDELPGFSGGASIEPIQPSLAQQARRESRGPAPIIQPREPVRADRSISFSPTSRFFADTGEGPSERRSTGSLLGLEPPSPAGPAAAQEASSAPVYRPWGGSRDESRQDVSSGSPEPPRSFEAAPAGPAPTAAAQAPKAQRRPPVQVHHDRVLFQGDDSFDSNISFETEGLSGPVHHVEDEGGRRWPVPSRGLVAVLGVAILLVGGFVGWQKYGPASAPGETGAVRLESLPEGADVKVDGVAHGKAPTVVNLTPGEHVLDFAANGKQAHLPVTVVGGEEIVARVTLFPNGPPGSLQITTIPQGASVSLNGEPHGQSPIAIDELPPGEHTVVVENAAGRIEQRVIVPPGATVPVTLAISGWLVVEAPIGLKVLERGRPLGVSGPERIMIAAGRRRIELANEELAFRDDQVVDIKAGTLTTLHARVAPAMVHLTSDKPADVTLDGRSLGRTPLMNQSTALGMHEIVFTNPTLGELRYTVVLRAGTNRLAANFKDLEPSAAAKAGFRPRPR